MTIQDEEKKEKTFDEYFQEAINDGEPSANDVEELPSEQTINKDIDQVNSDDSQENINDSMDLEDNQKDSDEILDSKDSSEETKTEYQELYEREKQKTATWAGRISKANQRADDAERRLQEILEQSKVQSENNDNAPSSNNDEDKVITAFREDFPDLLGPIELIVKREVAKHVSSDLAKIKPKIESIQKFQKEYTTKTHIEQIADSHPDWESIANSPDLENWIESKPSYISKALRTVVNSGTAKEVIDLLSTYKTETKRGNTNKPIVKNSSKIDALLAVPATSHRIPKEKPDKADFDSAWDEITKAERK